MRSNQIFFRANSHCEILIPFCLDSYVFISLVHVLCSSFFTLFECHKRRVVSVCCPNSISTLFEKFHAWFHKFILAFAVEVKPCSRSFVKIFKSSRHYGPLRILLVISEYFYLFLSHEFIFTHVGDQPTVTFILSKSFLRKYQLLLVAVSQTKHWNTFHASKKIFWPCWGSLHQVLKILKLSAKNINFHGKRVNAKSCCQISLSGDESCLKSLVINKW